MLISACRSMGLPALWEGPPCGRAGRPDQRLPIRRAFRPSHESYSFSRYPGPPSERLGPSGPPTRLTVFRGVWLAEATLPRAVPGHAYIAMCSGRCGAGPDRSRSSGASREGSMAAITQMLISACRLVGLPALWEGPPCGRAGRPDERLPICLGPSGPPTRVTVSRDTSARPANASAARSPGCDVARTGRA